MKIKGAIFDMDGTIVDSLFFWPYLWRRIGIKYMGDESFAPSEEADRTVRTMIYDDAMAYFKEYYKIPGDVSDFLSFAKDGVEEFYEKEVCAKPGAAVLLDYLKKSGVRLTLASASSVSYIQTALRRCSLEGYFESVISCAQIGVGKEKPDIFLKAADIMQTEPERICVFEDSFVALRTAKAAGFKTVGIYDRNNYDEEKLRELADIFLEEGRTLDSLISEIDN